MRAIFAICIWTLLPVYLGVSTILDLSASIASTHHELNSVVGMINIQLDNVVKVIDADPTCVVSPKARRLTSELYSEVSELSRQSIRTHRNFESEFAKLYQSSAASKLSAFLKIHHVQISTITNLSARVVHDWQVLKQALHGKSGSYTRDSFFSDFVMGNYQMLGVIILSCLIFFPWKTAIWKSILIIIAFMLVYQTMLSTLDNMKITWDTITRMKDSFIRNPINFKFEDFFNAQSTSTNLFFKSSEHFETVSRLRRQLATDFDLLCKGVDISIQYEEEILTSIEYQQEPLKTEDRAHALSVLRNNAFRLPPLQFQGLRAISDSEIVHLVQSTDNLHSSASEAAQEMSSILSSGFEVIMTAKSMIARASNHASNGNFKAADELVAVVSANYGDISMKFDVVLNKIREVQIKFEMVQTERSAIVKSYRKKQLKAGVLVAGAAAITVATIGSSLPAAGVVTTTALGVAVTGHSIVKALKTREILGELTEFSLGLGGFRHALSRIRAILFGSKEQLRLISRVLKLAQHEMAAVGLKYEPMNVRAREGLAMLYAQALEEQKELLDILGFVDNSPEPAKIDAKNV